MLLIMCVIFLMYNVRYLIKGGLFFKTTSAVLLQGVINKENELAGKHIDKEKTVISGIVLILLLLFFITMMVIEIITFIHLLDIDSYKWPTILCILMTLRQVVVINLSKRTPSKGELEVEKLKLIQMKPRSNYGIISATIHCVYYSYMILTITKLV